MSDGKDSSFNPRPSKRAIPGYDSTPRGPQGAGRAHKLKEILAKEEQAIDRPFDPGASRRIDQALIDLEAENTDDDA